MKHNEIETQLTWDLSSLFENQAAFDKQYEAAQALLTDLSARKGHISDNLQSYIGFMEDEETFERYINNLTSYAHMATDVEPDNIQQQENLSKSFALYQQSIIALSFVPLEIIEHKEIIEEWLKEEDCR